MKQLVAFSVLVVASLGCHRHKPGAVQANDVAQPTDTSGAAAAPAPEAPVDNRTPGQVVVDTLGQAGFQCVGDGQTWQCTAQGNTWAFTVSTGTNADGSVTVFFDSTTLRAFAQKCAKFDDAASDLQSDASAFKVTCDDAAQVFHFQTAYGYAGADDAAWYGSHDRDRTNAVKLLDSIGAIRH
jgi:hypothetical protein